MKTLAIRWISSLTLAITMAALLAGTAGAAVSITSATVNGGATTTVGSGAAVTVSLSVTSSAGADQWRGTRWRISTTAPGSTTCQNTPDHNGSGSWTESFSVTAPTTSGTYNLYLQATTDGSCSTTTGSLFTLTNAVTVDATAPSVTVDSTVPGTISPIGSSLVTWNANEAGTYTVRVGASSCSNGTVIAGPTAYVAASSVATTVNASSLTVGSNTIRICVTDASGNAGSATTSITLQAVAITAATLNGASTVTVAGGASITAAVTGTVASGGTWNGTAWRISTTAPGTTTCANTTNRTGGTFTESFTVTAPAATGTYNLYIVPSTSSSCGSGNEAGAVFAALSVVVVDATAPAVTIDSVTPSSVGAADTSTVGWNANEAGTVIVRLGASCSSGTILVASTSYPIANDPATSLVAATNLLEGANTVRVCVTDGVGNTGSATTTITKDSTAPAVTIDSVVPATMSSTGSSVVTWHADESGTSTVRIGGTDCTDGAVIAGPAAYTSGDSVQTTVDATSLVTGSNGIRVCVTDALANTGSATSPVTRNDVPSCDGVVLATTEDNAGDAAPSCTDGDTLTYEIVDAPTHGTASVVAGQLHYEPAADYNGSDSFTYRAGDGLDDSASATVSVTVTAVNDAPVCAPLNLSTDEDTTGSVTASCTDVEGDSLTYSIADPAAPGSASAVADELQYAPAADHNGTDGFTYVADDGTDPSAAAAVSVTIAAVNDAPTCDGIDIVTAEDTPADGSPDCSDVDGDPLTYEIVDPAGSGNASVASGLLHYEPQANHNGTDGFTYRADDGTVPSGTASVSVTINSVNDAPTCEAVALTTDEDTPVEGDPVCSDVDGDPFVVSIASQPDHGSAAIASGRLRYEPGLDYHGPDAFAYVADDGQDTSAQAAVTLDVTSVNDDPQAGNDTATTDEDTAIEINVLGNDSDLDGDTPSVVSATDPAHGTATVTPTGAIEYAPDADFNGTDTFEYTIGDGNSGSDTASVEVTVVAQPDVPVCLDSTVNTDEDVAVQVNEHCSDPDGDTLTYAVVDAPAHGSVTESGGVFTYTPDAGTNGDDTFTYEANDGATDSNLATVTVHVAAVDDSPTCQDRSGTAVEDGSTDVAPDCTDPEGSTLTYEIVDAPAHGTASVEAGQLRYVPAADYAGSDQFTYRASDGATTSGEALVSITVDPVNDAPVCQATNLTTNEDAPGTTAPLCTDVDADTLTYSIDGQGNKGTASVVAGELRYVPLDDVTGADAFGYRANDGQVSSNLAAVDVAIVPVNDDPDARDDLLTVAQDSGATVIQVLVNDRIAPDAGETLKVTSVTTPPHGSASIGAGGLTVIYTPAAGYHGGDSFTYTISDGNGGSDTAVVSITVTQAPAPPPPASGQGNVGTPASGTASGQPVAAAPPTPSCNGKPATIVGGAGNSTIVGTNGIDVIVDLSGDNTIDGRGGDDVVCSGPGSDKILGGQGNDWIDAGAGRNRVDGGKGNDILASGSGNDRITGNRGSDLCAPGAGRNRLKGCERRR